MRRGYEVVAMSVAPLLSPYSVCDKKDVAVLEGGRSCWLMCNWHVGRLAGNGSDGNDCVQ